MTIEEFTSGFTHTMKIVVAWNDMDALAHVNNTKYFLYYESARVDFLLQSVDLMPLPGEDIGPILAYIDCQFVFPLNFPDEIIVGSRITEVGNTSVKLEQAIYSTKQENVASTSKSVLVLINYKSGEKMRVPDLVRTLVHSK
jgi:acyl-CoA thioester hydrolase